VLRGAQVIVCGIGETTKSNSVLAVLKSEVAPAVALTLQVPAAVKLRSLPESVQPVFPALTTLYVMEPSPEVVAASTL
jgi:hypothetical protein